MADKTIIEVTREEAKEFKHFLRYKHLLGEAFKLLLHITFSRGITRKDLSIIKQFVKYYHVFEEMFEIRNGSMTLHFDNDGNLRERDITFKKKNEVEKT